ncbi:DUF1499 domain-containing protein [Aquisalimonas sp.]|uniref:DUF1499 domain-containing protein n=1 Tax=unclassified Aquisalimonas TaxID=2644645 RepID=UPI0025C4350F|nr:DUF1499 domain-containing protein [Aquisalimonas sp.]
MVFGKHEGGPRQRAVAGVGVALGVVAGLVVLLAGPWYQLGWVGVGTAFTMIEYGAWIGLAAAVCGFAVILAALVARNRTRALVGLVALVFGLGAASGHLTIQHRADTAPPIHDITTDTDDVPAFVVLVDAREAAPNAVEHPGEDVIAQQREAYPDLESRRYNASMGAVFDAAEEAARVMQWRIEAADRDDGRIEAVATTAWFGFQDDVVVRLREGDDAVTVDVRSASRIGRGDLGANAERIREYLAALDARFAGDD